MIRLGCKLFPLLSLAREFQVNSRPIRAVGIIYHYESATERRAIFFQQVRLPNTLFMIAILSHNVKGFYRTESFSGPGLLQL